jgi:hypothetical protein
VETKKELVEMGAQSSRKQVIAPAALALLVSAGCSSDTSASAAPADPGLANGSVYVVFSTIDTPDGRSGYVVTTPSIEGDVPIDVARGIEVPGGGQVYAPAGGGYVLVGSDEAPTFTRYELDAAGNLQPGPSLSFANLGVDTVWRHMIFVNESQAYFLDLTQRQVIRFNPATMLLERAIPVDDFACEEVQTEFGEPIRRDDGYYFPRSCWDLDITSSGASLVHLDPVTDEVTVSHDERCMGMQFGFMAESGNAYWFSDHDASMEWSVQRRAAPHDCSLRLRAGESSFDDEWELDLTNRTGGRSAVASVAAGGSRVWVKVFEPAAVEEAVPVREIDYTLKAWRWGTLDVESDDPVELETNSELVVYYGPPIEVDGRKFSPATTFSALGDETVLMELSETGITERFRVRGELRKVFRLR